MFGLAFDLSRPRVRGAIALNSEMGMVEARSLTLAIQRAERAEAAAAVAVRERDQAKVRAYQAEVVALAADGLPVEKRLHALIWRDWLTRLDACQRREQNLNYVLSGQFVQAVEALPRLDLDRLAWVCMMLGSRCELMGSGLEPHQLFARGTHQIAREDGAKAWRCREGRLARGRGMSVYYWVLPKGAVEFHDIGHGLETT